MNPLAIFAGPYATLAKWGVIVTLALACMAFGAVKMHQHDEVAYDALDLQFSTFKGETQRLGAQAKAEAEAKAAADKRNKDQTDAENKRVTDALLADIKRLRNARAGGSFVPAAPASASRPDLACFDRAELERSIRAFDTGLQGLVDEGSKATVDLNSAKVWAQR